MSESLVKKIVAAKLGLTTHEENVDLLIRLAQMQGAKAMKKKLEVRDAEIRKHLEKLQSIVGFWTPAEIEELNAVLALLDGQPEEGKRG